MKIKILSVAMLLLFFLTACETDDLGRSESQHPEAGITLTFQDAGMIVTRSSTTPQSEEETNIYSCYVIVFAPDGAVTVFERIAPESIKDEPGSLRTKKIILPLAAFETIDSGDEVHIILNPTSTPQNSLGLTKNNLQETFILSGAKGIAQTGLRGIPMYGTAKADKGLLAVDIRSSVSKVQVKFSEKIAGGSDYKFSDPSLLFYTFIQNTETAYPDGSSPEDANADAIREYAGIIDNPFPSAISHSASDYDKAQYIYPFPSSTQAISRGSGTISLNKLKFDYRRTGLLLYNADPDVPADRGRYYRLDLVKDGNYIDIENGRHYIINITSVKNWGYLTATEAMMHPSSNIEFELFSAGDKLYSNGQYGLRISENRIKTDYRATIHPLSILDQDYEYDLSKINKISETVDLATIRRELSDDAPVNINTSLTINFEFEKGEIHHQIAAQLIKIENGIETEIKTPYTTTLGSTPLRLKVRISGVGSVFYNYAIQLGNIEYDSDKFSFFNDYIYNSSEERRPVNLRRRIENISLGSNGSIESSANAQDLYIIKLNNSNINPVHWRVDKGNGVYEDVTDKNISGAFPLYEDRVITGVGFDSRFIVHQARPFYLGRFNENEKEDPSGEYYYLVEPYNAYSSSLEVHNIGHNPYGSYFTHNEAIEFNSYLTDGHKWELFDYDPSDSTSIGSMIIDRLFKNTIDRGGMTNRDYHHFNSWVNWDGDINTRLTYLPAQKPLSGALHQVYLLKNGEYLVPQKDVTKDFNKSSNNSYGYLRRIAKVPLN